MKRKGFTLIELLAVIVILAIIALIATPIVLNIIENSKDSSNKRSIELYGSAVEQAVAKAKLNGNILPSGKYTTEDGKTLKQGNTTFQVDYDGSKTACDIVISNKGNIYLENCKIKDKATEYTYGEKIYYNGEVVYFDVGTGNTCDNYTETQSNTGVKSGCMKFYAFNDDGGQTVNLILDHNTTAQVSWNKTYQSQPPSYYSEFPTNVNGPKELIDQLKEDTESWKGTETPSNYTMDQRGKGSNAYYTIDYSSYKARLITAQEIATITGNTAWNETTAIEMYFFDSNTNTPSETCGCNEADEFVTSGCKYGWLYDRTSTSCTTYGCLNNADSSTPSEMYGYWTASSGASSVWWAWYVDNYGRTTPYGDAGVVDNYYGVRPVIEVLKSNLS